jgi:hypothetical protein
MLYVFRTVLVHHQEQLLRAVHGIWYTPVPYVWLLCGYSHITWVMCFLKEPLGNQAITRSMQPCTGIGSSTSVHFYFSRVRGIKMDTNNSETKQGAVVTADLLQRKPHVEVIPT